MNCVVYQLDVSGRGCWLSSTSLYVVIPPILYIVVLS